MILMMFTCESSPYINTNYRNSKLNVHVDKDLFISHGDKSCVQI